MTDGFCTFQSEC